MTIVIDYSPEPETPSDPVGSVRVNLSGYKSLVDTPLWRRDVVGFDSHYPDLILQEVEYDQYSFNKHWRFNKHHNKQQ